MLDLDLKYIRGYILSDSLPALIPLLTYLLEYACISFLVAKAKLSPSIRSMDASHCHGAQLSEESPDRTLPYLVLEIQK